MRGNGIEPKRRYGLARRRRFLEINQYVLAQHIGISQGLLSNIERCDAGCASLWCDPVVYYENVQRVRRALADLYLSARKNTLFLENKNRREFVKRRRVEVERMSYTIAKPDLVRALITIAGYPVTDPIGNQDAANMQKIALDALGGGN